MTAVELLNWARGPGLQISVAAFLIGMVYRVLEMYLLGKRRDYSEPRSSGTAGGIKTLLRRFWPAPGMAQSAPLTVFGGYVFHLGFFITLLFFTPHILLLKEAVGFSWPGLPNGIIDITTIVSVAALVALLINRMVDPVRRYLATFQDYFALVLTLLPLATGYVAFHRLWLPYEPMLAIHILSVELLLIAAPFTKLVHAVTFVMSRWYTGQMAARKGVEI